MLPEWCSWKTNLSTVCLHFHPRLHSQPSDIRRLPPPSAPPALKKGRQKSSGGNGGAGWFLSVHLSSSPSAAGVCFPQSHTCGVSPSLSLRLLQHRESHYSWSFAALPQAKMRSFTWLWFFFLISHSGPRGSQLSDCVIMSNKWQTLNLSLLSPVPQPISNADFIVPVEIDGTVHQVTFQKSALNIFSALPSHLEFSIIWQQHQRATAQTLFPSRVL